MFKLAMYCKLKIFYPRMLLIIGYWNIHGLSDVKLEYRCEFFNNVHRQFDIVCFSETMNDSPRNLPGFQTCYVLNAKKYKKRGRKSGGLLVFCKIRSF